MNNDLISRDALRKAIEPLIEDGRIYDILSYIDNAPAIELTESDIQEILRPRCMSVVTNEYLIALHRGPGKFTLGELRAWLYENAYNNIGTQYEKDVVEIINRLDGFARFCKDRRAEI